MTKRTLTCWLAASLALASCKSDDKPTQPAKTTTGSPQEKAAETVEAVQEKTDTAVDKAMQAARAAGETARAAGETAKAAGETAKAAGELARDRAGDAVTQIKTLQAMISVLDEGIAKAIAAVEAAPSDDARKAATASLEKLRQEKQQLDERLAELKDAGAR